MQTQLVWKPAASSGLIYAKAGKHTYYVNGGAGEYECRVTDGDRYCALLGLHNTIEKAKLACERHADPKSRLKRARGAMRRAIEAAIVSTDQAHEQGYMGKAELEA